MRRRRRAPRLAPMVVPALVVAACGIPTGEDSFDRLADEEVPFRLAEPSTTTTTTTTTLPPPTAPPTTPPDAPDTTLESTTTTLPTEAVAVYLLSRDGLQPVPGELPLGFGIAQLVALLEAGPPDGAAGSGLDTLIAPGLIGQSSVEGGVVTVDLIDEEYDRIPARDLRAAIAQIVLTFTANLRGVGQVSFTNDGAPLRVQKGDGILAAEGEPLAFDDYSVMLAERTIGPEQGADAADGNASTSTSTTSTSTSTSTTTAPPTAPQARDANDS